jgi:hypothetical protein
MKLRFIPLMAGVVAGCGGPSSAPSSSPSIVVNSKARDDGMSAMGRIAALHARRASGQAQLAASQKGALTPFAVNSPGNCSNGPDCGDEDHPFVDPDTEVQLASGQAETSIAVDRTGEHVVVGYNDFRGFSTNPISVSGVIFSDDGGRTFKDGGQLPSPGSDVIAGQKFPQVFGDPTVKYLGDCTFVYGSILLKKLNSDPADPNTVQTMSVHRSTDCGHTWQGPFEVTAATNPTGTLVGGAPTDAADKEFLDVDHDTGRLMISWTNFAVTGPQIRTAFSDDASAGAPPTWSAGVIVAATPLDGQGSMPAFAAHSHDVYVTWGRFTGIFARNIGFSSSSDDGLTWSAPISINPTGFLGMDQVLGNDRVHNFPSIAVDNSHGRHRGNIYVAYADNSGLDGADITLQRSTDGGKTFSAPLKLNSRPGKDRAQWFPSVSVDNTFGRVYVMFFDQGVATSGDLMQTTYTFSDDGGVNWVRPRPLTDRPYHAAWGNDSSQPNLGDYIQGAARDGDLYSAYAVTHPVGFTDGEPASGSMTVPDVESKHIDVGARFGASATLQTSDPLVTDSGHDGNIDPGEVVTASVPLTNYVTNPLNATTLHDVTAFAETTAADVLVLPTFKILPTIKPGETGFLAITMIVGSKFVPGTPIDLTLHVLQAVPLGFITLHVTLDTGVRTATTLLSETFDEVAAGALPAGWHAVHAGGANAVPWTTSSSFCGTRSNGAFHTDAIDGPVGPDGTMGDPTRWERLFSPAFTIPADSDDVTIEFDVCYDTEDEPSLNIQAYDGMFLRVFDGTAGHIARSVLVDAFESKFTTGDLQGYPKHLPRGNSPAYFEDMSVWAGDSQGFKHVRTRLPGMAGTTVQLRWEYTQDSGGICSDVRPGHSCGVLVDNIVVRSEKVAAPAGGAVATR